MSSVITQRQKDTIGMAKKFFLGTEMSEGIHIKCTGGVSGNPAILQGLEKDLPLQTQST